MSVCVTAKLFMCQFSFPDDKLDCWQWFHNKGVICVYCQWRIDCLRLAKGHGFCKEQYLSRAPMHDLQTARVMSVPWWKIKNKMHLHFQKIFGKVGWESRNFFYPRTFEENRGYCVIAPFCPHFSCDINSSLSFYFVHFIFIQYCHIVYVHVDAQ